MSTALYRRYRPETFAEVIGQEHVTKPLTAALSKNRVNHAYLFSGPRGCGKTTSARILARCLNCEEGPTPDPCGQCPSCVELARGGPGSLDVVEIDAASHGGVEDARSLRESAVFAPARDRFKVFILDEAHMVSPQGFNALLKIVEEPPPHVRFVFATTEPDKVIGTIRSRTHHYPFRLVPPERLREYLAELCAREEVTVEDAVLPLVVRAGAGSVRDSLSVLDQLMAGTGDEGLTYRLAVSLLGYTDAALLDSVVDALADRDAPTAFGVVEQVIESGHDPRRFVEDLLERLRDLVVTAAVPDGDHAVHRSLPADRRERMQTQAARFGRAELSRAADVVNAAYTEMTGATSPRLHLELLCARLLLPGADGGESGLVARLDRLERRIAQGAERGGPPQQTPPSRRPPPGTAPPATGPRPASPTQGTAPAPGTAAAPVPGSPAPGGPAPREPGGRGCPSDGPAGPARSGNRPPEPPAGARDVPPRNTPVPEPVPPSGTSRAPEPPRGAAPPGDRGPAVAPSSGVPGLDELHRLWPGILSTLAGVRRTTWSLVSQYAQVVGFDGRSVVLGFDSPGRAAIFGRGQHQEVLRQILSQALRTECTLQVTSTGAPEGRGDPGGRAGPPPGRTRSPGGPGPVPVPSPGGVPGPGRPSATSWDPPSASGAASREERDGRPAGNALAGGQDPGSSGGPGPFARSRAGARDRHAAGVAVAGPPAVPATGTGHPARPVRGDQGQARGASPARDEDIPPPDEPPPLDGPEEERRPPDPALTGADRARAAAAAGSAAAGTGKAGPEKTGTPERSGPGSAGPGPGNGSPRGPRTGRAPAAGGSRDDEASLDDRDLEGSGLVGEQVVVQYLGGSLIAEQDS